MDKAIAVKKPRKDHDEDFKRRVLENRKTPAKPAAQVAREFGVSIFNLYSWPSETSPPRTPGSNRSSPE